MCIRSTASHATQGTMKHRNIEELLYSSYLDCENITQLNEEMNKIRKRNRLASTTTPTSEVNNAVLEDEPKLTTPTPTPTTSSSEPREQVNKSPLRRRGVKSRKLLNVHYPLKTLGFHNSPEEPIFRFKPQLRALSDKVNSYPAMTPQLIINRSVYCNGVLEK